jgi:orotidine-5'-phosphate decarboxylase
MLSAKNRLIVALDVPDLALASSLVSEIGPLVGAFKVGLELISAQGGPPVVQAIHSLGCKVFYDGKFNDIPNTVGSATRATAQMGVWMLNVHASAGLAALKACAANKGNAIAVAVTVLTSLPASECSEIFGASVESKVEQFTDFALHSGLDGIVCSPQELRLISKAAQRAALCTVVPGVRPAWAATDDQARVTTPHDAIRLGATYLVIGRPILKPPPDVGSPRRAVELVLKEVNDALCLG